MDHDPAEAGALPESLRGFDPAAWRAFGPRDVERLLGDAGIIRHRGKIESTIDNARAPRPSRRARLAPGCLVASRRRRGPAERLDFDGAAAIAYARVDRPAKELKRRWRFVGPTTVYAFMQAMGLVNDHLEGCDVRAELT